MRPVREPRAGFTMIELLIAAVIVGALASAAIPSYQRYHLRAETAEAKANLGAIRTASESYFADHGIYVAAAPAPVGAPGLAPQAWADPADFGILGWRPTGPVRFQYAVTVGGSAQGFTAEALGDLDGDGVTSLFGFVKPEPAGPLDGVLGCPGTGVVVNGSSVPDTVGPCDGGSGTSIF